MFNLYKPLLVFSVASFVVPFDVVPLQRKSIWRHIGTTEQHFVILFCSFIDIYQEIEKVIITELTAAWYLYFKT